MKTEKYIPALDGIRVIFMVLVAWFHFWQQSWIFPIVSIGNFRFDFTFLAQYGFMGVEGFFVLSGFCLFLPFARDKEKKLDVRGFYKKRFLRIFPSFWFALLVCGGFALYDATDKVAVLQNGLAYLFLVSSFKQGWFHTPINGVMWSLVAEIHFYILFPFIVKIFKKSPFVVTLVTVLGCTVYRFWVARNGYSCDVFYMHQLPGIIDAFILGMLAAELTVSSTLPKYGGEFLLIVAAAFFCILLKSFNGQPQGVSVQVPQTRLRPLFMLAFALAMYAAPHVGKITNFVLGNRVVRFLSSISLNVFLWHQWLSWRLKTWHIPPYDTSLEYPMYDATWRTPYTLVFIAATLVVAVLTTFLIEKNPFLRKIKT